jgi:hypothetical protein
VIQICQWTILLQNYSGCIRIFSKILQNLLTSAPRISHFFHSFTGRIIIWCAGLYYHLKENFYTDFDFVLLTQKILYSFTVGEIIFAYEDFICSFFYFYGSDGSIHELIDFKGAREIAMLVTHILLIFKVFAAFCGSGFELKVRHE